MAGGPLRTLYDRAPRPLQAAGLNLFGLRNVRRMAAWNRYLDSIRFTETMPREAQVRFVAMRLKEQLAYVVENVPRYAGKSRLLPELRRAQSDAFALLQEFPLVTRQEVMAEPKAFMARRAEPGDLVKTVTSGTTGTPFATWMEKETFLRSDALWWRRTEWAGYQPGEWIARLVGDPVVAMDEAHPRRPWRRSHVDRRLYFSTFHLNRETAAAVLEAMDRYRPEYLMAYPSALEILAGYAADLGYRPTHVPKAVLFSSEPLFAHQRKALLQLYPTRIVGLYGTAERIITASECEAGEYHLALVDGYVEGQFGRIQPEGPPPMTTLMNRAMPLVRFALGDMLEFHPERTCSCGRTLPIMSPVVTKVEDWLSTPSGRRISPSALTWAFKDLPGVRRSQIVQNHADRVEVRLDMEARHFGQVDRLLQERLSRMFFHEVAITSVRTSDIELTRAGKTRFVVRNVTEP